VIIVTSDNEHKELFCQFVLVFFVFLQKNIAQKPVDGRETVKEAFSCTPPEIVSAAKKNRIHTSRARITFQKL
jgi:hypothetical protein